MGLFDIFKGSDKKDEAPAVAAAPSGNSVEFAGKVPFADKIYNVIDLEYKGVAILEDLKDKDFALDIIRDTLNRKFMGLGSAGMSYKDLPALAVSLAGELKEALSSKDINVVDVAVTNIAPSADSMNIIDMIDKARG